MDKLSIISSIRQQYIDENLESAKKINYTSLTKEDGLTKVFYKDLPNLNMDGYPIASDFVDKEGKAYSVDEFDLLPLEKQKECQLRYYYLPFSHELYVGTTGSGKTTGCVEPQLRAISSQKNCPNIFITDPKGELFDRNAQHLINKGYRTYVINFKDLIRSDKWNPFLEIYDIKMKVVNLGKSRKVRSMPVKESLELIGSEEDFILEQYIEYDGKAFPTVDAFENYINFELDYLEANIDSLLNQLANMMIKVQSSTDKSWEFGSQELLKGLVQCMLEDAIDEKSGFTRDMMNIRTLYQYYLALKTPILSGNSTLSSHPLLRNKSIKAKTLMSTALGNAPNTMRSYCGVFNGAIKEWFQGHIFALTSRSTIQLNSSSKKPFVIFLITRDYEKSDFLIAGLIIDWVYRQMLENAEKTKKPRALHFLLDEFGNIPKIKDLENKISTARSRNIWFHLFIQSYKQIDFVYGEECSGIIRDNCNSQIFLGSQNRVSKEIFSNECGKHNIASLESKLNVANNSIVEVPLVPVSDLDQIKPGQMYTKRLYMPVITSQFIRSYVCAAQGTFKDFLDSNGLATCTPLSIEPFSSPKFTYAKLNTEDNDIDFDDIDF